MTKLVKGKLLLVLLLLLLLLLYYLHYYYYLIVMSFEMWVKRVQPPKNKNKKQKKHRENITKKEDNMRTKEQ